MWQRALRGKEQDQGRSDRPAPSCDEKRLAQSARKVREAYWRVYNNLYVGSQEAMVPYYPRMPNENRNTYQRYELDYFI